MSVEEIKTYIRDVPDFPEKGIVFKDITPLLNDAYALRRTSELLMEQLEGKQFDKVVGIESRGFFFGAMLALELNAGLVLVRKPGKLPAETIEERYELEYGSDALEMHKDAIKPGDRVLIHDDLLATGGTAAATCKLVEKLGGKVEQVAFLVELGFLNGKDKLKDFPISTLIKY